MANILFIGGDGPLSELIEKLHLRHHKVSAQPNVSAAVAELRARSQSYQLIVLNLSRNRPEDWEAFDRVRELVQGPQAIPRIVCFSTAYWGPRMQLSIEQKGGRFVYLG